MNILNYFNKEELIIINKIINISKKNKCRAYIVGGAIRDIILKYPIRDIDICIEEDPIKFLKELSSDASKVVYHKDFYTAYIEFQNGTNIDLIGCRKEKYNFDGALPKVKLSNIDEDLKRRDFTVNSLAYDLIENKIINLFNGIDDIENKSITKIHKNSYLEDGTRIFRAIKYAARYNFFIKDEEEIKDSILKGALFNISYDRIMTEILGLIKEDNWILSIEKLKYFNILDIDIKRLKLNNILLDNDDIYARILRVFYSLDNNHNIFLDNCILDKSIKKALKNYYNNKNNIESMIEKACDNFTVYNILKNTLDEERILLCFNKNIDYKIINFNNNLKNVKLRICGNYIKDNYKVEGKMIGTILNKLMKFKLNLGIKNDKKFLKYIKETNYDFKH